MLSQKLSSVLACTALPPALAPAHLLPMSLCPRVSAAVLYVPPLGEGWIFYKHKGYARTYLVWIEQFPLLSKVKSTS